jgi:hypothetical protein
MDAFSETILHRHGDLLAQGHWSAADHATRGVARELGLLLAVARRARLAVPAVRPSPEFRERLREELIAAAGERGRWAPWLARPSTRSTEGLISRGWQMAQAIRPPGLPSAGLRAPRLTHHRHALAPVARAWKSHSLAAASGVAAGVVLTAAAVWWLIRGTKAHATEAG